MAASPLSLMIVALPSMAASLLVLALASVGRNAWITQLLAIGLACCLAAVGRQFGTQVTRRIAAWAIMVLTLLGLAVPLFGDTSDPERWIGVGPLSLYAAPLLLPAWFAACAVLVGESGKHQVVVLAAVLTAASLLALQPDASQLLALLVGATVMAMRYRLGLRRASLVMLPLALMSVLAFSTPDPLRPLPHVEGVFALGLAHSLWAGLFIWASAAALLLGLWMQSLRGSFWLSAVGAYYAVLFVCSAAGMTPAPLVGYGAGPVLGFGLMAGVHGWFGPQSGPDKGVGEPLLGP